MGGRQTLVSFMIARVSLINRHQTLRVGTSYQDTSEDCFQGQSDCKILNGSLK